MLSTPTDTDEGNMSTKAARSVSNCWAHLDKFDKHISKSALNIAWQQFCQVVVDKWNHGFSQTMEPSLKDGQFWRNMIKTRQFLRDMVKTRQFQRDVDPGLYSLYDSGCYSHWGKAVGFSSLSIHIGWAAELDNRSKILP